MGNESRTAAEEEGADLPGRIGGVDDGEAEQRSAQRPGNAVYCVPRAIDPRDLVGEEFGKGANARRGDHPGLASTSSA